MASTLPVRSPCPIRVAGRRGRRSRRRAYQLAAGAHVIRVYLATVGSGGGAGNFNWFRLVAATSSNPTTPYGGTPVALPGLVQAENFDIGAEGVAYHDATPGNKGGAYRSTDVDIEPTQRY